MPIDAPLCLYNGHVLREWIDYNGHMNVASYVQAFDHATDALMEFVGLGPTYRASTHCSAFVLETHVNYQREMVEGEAIRITTQLLGFDAKRIHYFHRMYHGDTGYLTATTELITIHVDLKKRQGAPMPLAVLDRLNAVMAQHIQMPRPPQSGRVIGVNAKPPTGG
ncbi:MAG: thioesterase family protein [Candidatus Competibacteraceae bacterium]|nr:thioesterase family protein [Candidatus Competibacteraceae bacterium]